MNLFEVLKLILTTPKSKKTEKDIINYFTSNKVPTSALSSPPFQQTILREILNTIGLSKKLIILDFGTGLGNNIPTLLPFAAQIYAADISPIAIKAFKKRFGSQKISPLLIPPIHFSIKKDFFDLIVCTAVLEHVPNIKRTLLELKTTLKKDGYLIVGIPNYQNLRGVFKKIIDAFLGEGSWDVGRAHPGGFERFITPKLIEKHLTDLNFKIISSRGADYNTAWSIPNLNLVPNFLEPLTIYGLGKMTLLKQFGMLYYVLAKRGKR